VGERDGLVLPDILRIEALAIQIARLDYIVIKQRKSSLSCF
jgi:hypothetical protein